MDDISCHAPADLRMVRVAEKTKRPNGFAWRAQCDKTRKQADRHRIDLVSVVVYWLLVACFMPPRIRLCRTVANGGKLTKNRGRAPETGFLDPRRTLFIRRARNTRNEWRYNSRPFQASAGYQRIIDIRQAGASGRHAYGAR